jgi:hypothetical protein
VTANLPGFVRQREFDAAPGRRVAVPPPLDEARRIRIYLRILGELHKRACRCFIEMRQLEAELVRLMLDVT